MRSFKEYYEDWCPLRNLALLDDATVKMIKTLSSHIYIKSGVNHMPLTHSSVAHKFNDSIVKKFFLIFHRSNPFGYLKTQWKQCNLGGPLCVDSLKV